MKKLIVPFEMAQIPDVLFATGWTNHQIILNRCKSDTERLFYNPTSPLLFKDKVYVQPRYKTCAGYAA